MMIRRLSVLAAGTAAAVVLSVAPAQAHFCFFTNPNPNADAGRGGSQGFFPFSTITEQFFGLCSEGTAILAEAGGVTPTTLINAHGAMAGPTGGNKAIRHLDMGPLLAAGPDAFAACDMELPADWFA